MENRQIKKYATIAESAYSTVVGEYVSDIKRAEHYQSEDDLEKAFIQQLESQAYEYLSIANEQDLRVNLRRQLERLNNVTFSDVEWEHFFAHEIANPNAGIVDKTRSIQEDFIKNLKREDGTTKNIYLINKKDIHENYLQVINQYVAEDGQRSNRYDVTILVNGLPLVHVELKRRGVSLQEAFNQINRYQQESFWSASGLFEYIQLFVISNGTYTKYYSNTTRNAHIREKNMGVSRQGRKTSNSYEFTTWWADAKNKPIVDLLDFTKTFFAKHSLLNVLTRYCVFTTDELLLVMRPYQIVATERIITRIETSSNHKKAGSIEAGGYIWHTTGSGKTLTSFKTAQLASRLSCVDKVLFVVDRKDLDYQTMREYDKFEKGAANGNKSTSVLAKQMGDPNVRIIITTIQKLDRFIKTKKNQGHEIFHGQIVLIFDECHRSQFGDMHKNITRAFKNYHLFGFTGTPIFPKNAPSGGRLDLKTTEQAFGERLHVYSLLDATIDKNVLRFKVDYVSTMKEAEDIDEKEVGNIDREEVLLSPERISNIVQYIREHFDQKTKRNSTYKIQDRRFKGFNSILAVSSIEAAKGYYYEFKKQLADVPSDQQLKIATIFSFGTKDEDGDGMIDENPEDTKGLSQSSQVFLDEAIADYNALFETSYDTSPKKFQNYYENLSERMRNREVDILIVVNMFLTGFDATTLNTLWVDKNLRHHGLIQAFSRTNRILNSVKAYGNIVCFRNLEKAKNEALALFGDKEASGVVLLKSFDEYYHGYQDGDKEVRGYVELIAELQDRFPVGHRIIGEQNQKDFIKLYGSILRMRNILTSSDEFEDKEILSERDIQDYHSMYIDLYHEFRKSSDSENESINDDIVFEMELIKQVEINIDYIIELIKKYHASNQSDKEMLVDIDKAIDSSVELRNKKDLIHQFIATLDAGSMVDEDWQSFVNKEKIEALERIIAEENLDREETYSFIQNAFRDGGVATTGTALSKVLPPVSRFSQGGERSLKRAGVLGKLSDFFEKFFDISERNFSGE